MSTALVTGPTSGIGQGFARRLAADGHDLVLVARDADRLALLAAELRVSGARAEVIVADLADAVQLSEVERRLSMPDLPVDVLVNNAGFGMNQRFVGGSLDREQLLLDVTVKAVMRLTHAAVPGMRQRNRGLIINVSSVAGFAPFGSYSAAKAWTTFFSQGLASELTGTAVRVVAVCPGFVRTEFHERAGIDMSKSPDWMWLTVEDVVNQAFHDVHRGKVISVPGAQYKALAATTHLLPREAVRRLEGFRRRRLGR